jgi:lysozyme family protein
MINVQNITSKLALMPDAALKQYAEMHKDDPYTFSLAMSESNRRKQLRSQAPQVAPQPKVVDQELADMDIRKALPEDLGIARLPVDMNMAGGGIVAFGGGGMSYYDKGGSIKNAGEGFTETDDSPAFKFALSNTLNLEGGLNKNDKVGGLTNYGISQKAYPNEDIANLTPTAVRAIYKRDYWDKIGGDELAARDPKFAALAFDTAVHHGVSGAKKMINQSGENPEKLLEIRSDKLKSLVENNPEKYGKQAKGWANRISKLAFNLLPGSTAQAATLPEKPAAPEQEGIAAIPAEPTQSAQAQPEQSDSGSGTAAALGTAAAGLGYYPAKAGVAALQDKIKTADAARVLEGSKMERALAEQAARNSENLRLGLDRTPGSGVTATTDKILAEKAAERVAAKQAAITGSEMAGKYGAGTALRGLGSMARLAVSAPVMGLGAIGEQLGNFQRGVMAAPTGEKLKEALYENPMLGAMDPDAAFGAAIMDAPKIAEKQNAALNPNARVDDRTPRNPENYRVAPAATVDDRTKRDPANYRPEKIAEVAKAVTPPTEDNQGWSGNDWLQFGLAMMAGQSQYALQNIGQAGLSVLANKAEKQREQNKLDIYKSVHGEKPGEYIQIAERLMAADPKLTFADAMEKATLLRGGSTKQDLADAKAEANRLANLKNYDAAIAKLDEKYSPMMMSGSSQTAKNMKADYDAKVKELRKKHGISEEDTATVAPKGPALKVVGIEKKP